MPLPYPKVKYPDPELLPDEEPQTVNSPEDEERLGEGWGDSPAEFGIETAPGKVPDPVIASNRKQPPSEPVSGGKRGKK